MDSTKVHNFTYFTIDFVELIRFERTRLDFSFYGEVGEKLRILVMLWINLTSDV